MRRAIGIRIVATAFCFALLLSMSPAAIAGPTIPKYAARIAGKQLGHGASWSLWLFGHHRTDQCWATKTLEGGSSNEDALCGFSVPKRPWQFAAKGTFGSGQSRESLLFFLTRKSVSNLAVQAEIGQKRPVWTHLKTKRLTAHVAMRAQIKSGFAYAVGIISGSLTCVGRIIATTRTGKKISGHDSSGCAGGR